MGSLFPRSTENDAGASVNEAVTLVFLGLAIMLVGIRGDESWLSCHHSFMDEASLLPTDQDPEWPVFERHRSR